MTEMTKLPSPRNLDSDKHRIETSSSLTSSEGEMHNTIPTSKENSDLDILSAAVTSRIKNEIDLEVLLKHKELEMIEKERAKIIEQMKKVENAVKSEGDVNLRHHPHHPSLGGLSITIPNRMANQSLEGVKSYNNRGEAVALHTRSMSSDGSFQLLYQPTHPHPHPHPHLAPASHPFPNNPAFAFTSSTFNPSSPSLSNNASESFPGPAHASAPTSHYRTRSSTSMSSGCLYQRSDGKIVKITCPNCQRSNFLSIQGFLNHCRIAHSKEYMSQEAAALECGEEVDMGLGGEWGNDTDGGASTTGGGGELEYDGWGARFSYPSYDSPDTTNLSDTNAKETRATSFEATNDTTGIGENGEAAKHKLGEEELLKKMMRQGKMEKTKFEELIKLMKRPVQNAHLFEDEVDEEDGEEDGEKDGEGNSQDVNENNSKKPQENDATSLAEESEKKHIEGRSKETKVVNDEESIRSPERKRRQSRGGINISIEVMKEKQAEEAEEAEESKKSKEAETQTELDTEANEEGNKKKKKLRK